MGAIGKPRGTRDFGPDDMARRRYVELAMRAIFKRYGYREIATPTIEHLELFTIKSGEGIVEETYAFTDKSGRELALRPELTAPVMRFYVEQMQMEPKPLKLFYFGNCFRYDRPQAGRYREFWQMGCELIGSNQPEAIAELISLAYHALRGAGLRDIILRVGDLTLLHDLMDTFDMSNKAAIMRLIDKGDLSGVAESLADWADAEAFLAFLQCRDLATLGNFVSSEQAKPLQDVMDWLDVLDTPAKLDTAIARGLEYYRGIVFEVDAPALGAEKQLCGGGEYSLAPLLGGGDTPTAGFALGFDRILLALEQQATKVANHGDLVYITPVGETMRRHAARLAHSLRMKGISVEMDIMRRSVSKSLQHGNRIGAHYAVIVGAEEWDHDAVLIKDMHSGAQEEVPVESIAAFIS
jgi:histidyl-tRNA synthetase